ncbi:MAG: diaminopimelate decarboxylase [Thiohalomonadaceae bacterium]
MEYLSYRNNSLHIEDMDIATLADRYGTPCYIYSRAAIERHYRAFEAALAGTEHLICYAVKANSNLAVLNVLARLGAGFDIVSVGELERVLAAGGDPAKIVFSGVGKRADEMRRALELGIHCFNVESEAELERLNRIAGEMGKRAPVSMRVNPNVDAKTHPYISTGLKENKFGIDIHDAQDIYSQAATLPNIELIGVDCHIGSQITTIEPFIDALERMLLLIDTLYQRGIAVRHLDMGGGLGITYRDEMPPLPGDYAAPLLDRLAGHDIKLIIEPGRAIIGNAGLLLTRVEYLKPTPHRNFAIVDAAMNDLLRPTLYDAWMDIIPVTPREDVPVLNYDIVGPICESGDFLGKDRKLALAEGDLLAIGSAGAYGFAMSSNYNTRPRSAEVMVDGKDSYLVRQRETITALYASESLLPA